MCVLCGCVLAFPRMLCEPCVGVAEFYM